MTNPVRVLITGGNGFVGANLVDYLDRNTGWDLVVVDDMRAGSENDVSGKAVVHKADVGDIENFVGLLDGVDGVVHLASQTGVAPSVEDPRKDFLGNPATTFNALEACRRAGIERFVFASSGAALGDAEPPLNEKLVPRPLSPYGAGKLAGEAYCQAFAGSFGMNTAALRFSNVYGPRCGHKRNNAIPRFIEKSLGGEALEIYGDGSQSRDFVYVDDISSGIYLALTTDGIGGEVFQLATSIETTITQLAALVQDVTGSDAAIENESPRAGEVHRSSADISKAKELLGYEPKVSLREGLERTVEWYRSSST